MQMIFVGGAQEAGTSCLAVEMGGQWIVVDSGVRLDRKADPLPALALLEGNTIQAICVAHAHADHIGALPSISDQARLSHQTLLHGMCATPSP